MNTVKTYLDQKTIPKTTKEIIVWWEKRRLKFNLAFFIPSILTLTLTVLLLGYHPFFGFGLILMLAATANVCYFFGWITEIILRNVISDLNLKIGPIMLGIGTVLTVAVIILSGLFEILDRLL